MSSKIFSLFSGKWALVTGATSGIGEAFAKILAEQGVNLVISGRQNDKLLSLKNELTSQYKVTIETIAIDLSNPMASEVIFQFCEQKKILIEILINNAGYAIRTQDEFVYPQRVSSMLQVMVVSLTELCFRFGHQMKLMKRGWILNVSSIVGCFPAASTLTYSASKRYIIEYSRYLHYELKNDGVAVTCLMPGPTKTNFSTNNKLPIPRNLLFFYLSAEQVASKGLLALAKNKTAIITGGISKVLIWISKLIPSSLLYKTQKKIWVEKRDRYL